MGQVKLIRKKKFTATTFNQENKSLVIHVNSIIQNWDIYPFWGAQIALLKVDETLNSVSLKYANFAEVFSTNLAIELPDHTGIDDHIINLIKGHQPSYRLIYNLRSIELKILKTYIKTNLVNDLITSSKSPTNTPIFFVKKTDKNIWLYVNYKDLNNLTIKNKYSLPFIDECLN